MVNWNGCDTEEEIIIWEEGENARRSGKAHGETAKVWKNMINSHQHVFDLTRRKSGIHARYKRIQKEQDDVKYLLTKEPRGTFTWDNVQSRVTASNAAWNKLKNVSTTKLTQQKPSAKGYAVQPREGLLEVKRQNSSVASSH